MELRVRVVALVMQESVLERSAALQKLTLQNLDPVNSTMHITEISVDKQRIRYRPRSHG